MNLPTIAGIYQIRNTANGKLYIGSAVNIRYRWACHKARLTKGGHHSKSLQRAWDKYGEAYFAVEVVDVVQRPEDLLMVEQYYLDMMVPFANNGYNICVTAGNRTGMKHGQATKDKIAAHFRGKPLAEETKKKISQSSKGRVHSEQARRLLSIAHKGKIISEEARAKMKAHVFSEEHRKNLSESHKGIPQSAESRKKKSDSLKGRVSPTKGMKRTKESNAKTSAALNKFYAEKRAQNATGDLFSSALST